MEDMLRKKIFPIFFAGCTSGVQGSSLEWKAQDVSGTARGGVHGD
jgi:hypothetical protein